jgi:hypothetical protein
MGYMFLDNVKDCEYVLRQEGKSLAFVPAIGHFEYDFLQPLDIVHVQ